MGNSVKKFLILLALAVIAPLVLIGQDSTHVIRLKDITPKRSLASLVKGKLTFAPHYSVETGAGMAFSYITPANVTFVGDIASQGYSMLGIMGSHYTGNGMWNIIYSGYYTYSPTDFWGLGYTSGSNDAGRQEYDRRKFLVKYIMTRHLSDNFYAGPSLAWEWVNWENVKGGKTGCLGYGAVAVYDSRNSGVSPSQGIYAKVHHHNYTDFSSKPFYATALQFNAYRRLWKGGIAAFDLLSQFTYGSVPWTMLPTIGGTGRMRGYYRGRYIDNNAVSVQLELRQHIWESIGAAAWVGAANVWGKWGPFNLDNTLPGTGIGLRLKMSGGTVLRFDYGFGKNGQNGFVFGLNEAF